jgi:rfaE bifunctional protein kinase chain/domain
MPTAESRRLRSLIPKFRGRSILVVGDLMLDHYIRGSVSRISPEAPVPVVMVNNETDIPGGAGNVAHNLAELGARIEVLGVLGDDAEGLRLIADLNARGVASQRIVTDPSRVTSQKCRVIAERQQMIRFDRETAGPLSHETEKRLLDRLPEALREADALILSDYGKGVLSPRVLSAAIAQGRKRGIPVVVDPKVEHFALYKGVTCITPNAHEAWGGMRRSAKPGLEPLIELGHDILKLLKSESVLITRGPDGMSLFRKGGKDVHIPTQAREVFDVTGAGDTVIATLTLGLAAGATIEQAAKIANVAAGIVVGKLGTATTTLDEIAKALK